MHVNGEGKFHVKSDFFDKSRLEKTYWNDARIRTSFRAFSFSLELSFPILTLHKTIMSS